jgi:WD40 repeat protein
LAAGYGFPEFSVEIWDTKEMKSLKVLQAHSKSVTALVYLKDQKILLSGSCDMYVYAWNIEETEPLWNYKAHEGYIFTMIDLGEGMWASGSHDKTIKIWKAGDYEHKAVIYGHSDPVWCIVKLQEPDLIASCSADGYIFVWDYEGQESIKRIKAHKDQVNQIVAYRKSELISCSDDSTVKLWDWKKGELISQLLTTQSPIWGVLVAHDNETLFCYGEQANVVVYNMPDAQVINILYGFDQMIKSMIQTSEHFLVTGSYDFKIRYWHSVKVK